LNNEKVEALLAEIRDAQKQQLEEYRRMAGEALGLQKQALAQQTTSIQAQARHIKLYRAVIAVVAVVVVPLITYLMWILVKRL
jgi:DNA-binding protein H-NS